MHRWMRCLVWSLVFFCVAGLHTADATPFWGQNRGEYQLTILHNNDGESQLINAGAGLEDFGGVARFKTVVKKLKRLAVKGEKGSWWPRKSVLLLSSGDSFLAGPELNASFDNGVPYFDSIAARILGYDAMALGNHEFDFGPDVLANYIRGTRGKIPFVSANLDFSDEPGLNKLVRNRVIAKSIVVRDKGRRIGIVGLTTPQISFISSPRNVIIDSEIAEAAQEQIDRLTHRGIKYIILISHLQSVEEDIELASMLEDVDVMIAGGGDELLANTDDLLVPGDEIFGPYPLIATGVDGAKIPVVTTAGDYKYVGRLVVDFDRYGRVLRVDKSSGPVRVAGGDNPDAVRANPRMQTRVVEPVKAFVDGLAANIIATSDVDLEGRRNPGVRSMETNEGNLLADALLWQGGELAAEFGVSAPDVALQNGGGIRNNTLIPAGDISELTTFDIAPFSNFVTVVPNIPRQQFKEIMENAVSQIGGGRFAQISGFRMVYDPNGTAQVLDENGTVTTVGTRVQSITLNDGTQIVVNGEVQSGADINIATIDFLARGGDQYPFRGAAFTSVGVSYQQALSNYIQGPLQGVISSVDYPEGGEGRITP